MSPTLGELTEMIGKSGGHRTWREFRRKPLHLILMSTVYQHDPRHLVGVEIGERLDTRRVVHEIGRCKPNRAAARKVIQGDSFVLVHQDEVFGLFEVGGRLVYKSRDGFVQGDQPW